MPRVLLGTEDASVCRELATRLAAKGVEILQAEDAMSAGILAVRERPDLMVLDSSLPGGGGLWTAQRLRSDPGLSGIPIHIATREASDVLDAECSLIGAKVIRTSDGMNESLCATIEGAFETPDSESRPPRVLVIDDDFLLAKTLKTRLEAYGIEVVRAYNGSQGFWSALKTKPDVIITDYNMPEGRADHLISRMHQEKLAEQVPIIVITGFRLNNGHNYALSRTLTGMGVSKVLSKPLNFEELLNELKRHIHVNDSVLATA